MLDFPEGTYINQTENAFYGTCFNSAFKIKDT